MILLAARDITKHFGPDPVLDGVTFDVRPGDKIGLVGPNGAGKTTLLKILAGQLEADRGTVQRHGSARVDYLQQHPTFSPGQTLWDTARSGLHELIQLNHDAEQVARAMGQASDPQQRQRLARRYDALQHELQRHDAYHLDHQVERVLDGLGFVRSEFDMPAAVLSGGQQNRLLLARMLLTRADVLLMDEPSNHLDMAATEWLESFLAASAQAMLIVSHDRYFLDRVTNRTLELYRGTVDDYTGNFSAYWRQKAERLKVQSRAYEKQQELIAKAEEFIRRNHYGQKSAQAEDRRKKLARIEPVQPPRDIQAPVMGFPPASRTGDIVVRAEQLAKRYDRPLFTALTFDILRGQRWAVVGPNGTGKTTLLRCLVGQVPSDEGRIVLGSGVKVGYYDQLLSQLDPDAAVVDAIRPSSKEFSEPERRSLLARFGLQAEAVFQQVNSLSGGERSRAALAQLAAEEANFLALDEPTNHLDLWACDALERSLARFDGTVLLVSHDRYFLNRVADHLLVFEDDRVRIIEGNYDTYVDTVRRRQQEAAAAAPSAANPARPAASRPSSPRSARPPRPKRRFPYRKVADLEAEILQCEQQIEALHAEMLLPDVLRDGRRVRTLQQQIDQQRQTLATLYEHWEEACELN